MTDKVQPLVHIVGGGFSGLMTAYYCLKQGMSVTVYESQRWGGLLHSHQTPEGLVEEAANALLWTSELEAVSRDIGVPLFRAKPSAKKRYVALEKPETLNFRMIVPVIARFLLAKIKRQHRPHPHEVLSQWGARVLGLEFSLRILKAATRGVWGVPADRLSASLLLRPLLEGRGFKTKGSVAPEGGMQAWITGLTNYLRAHGAELRAQEITALPKGFVVLASTRKSKAALLSSVSPASSSLYDKMMATSLTSVTAHFAKNEPHPYPGFGILFHPDYHWEAAGVLFNDQIFASRSTHQSETWIFDRAFSSEAEMRFIVTAERRRLGLTGSALSWRKTEWPHVLPIYSPEHETRLAKLRTEQDALQEKKIFLIGNELGDIGLTSLAHQAKLLAAQIKTQSARNVPPSTPIIQGALV
ncbi:MAG: protoporphyrinogen/coproporphyrinogen oxidase [Bdellovibrio sp.]